MTTLITNNLRYFDTEADGTTKIDPPPFGRSLGDLTNNVFPSKTTDVSDYSTSTNFVNRTVDQTIFTHAAAIDVAGTQAELYHNDLVVLASTDYTVVLFMKMDDDSVPVVSSSSSDTSGDLGLILGGDFIDASASSDHSVTKKGEIYCVMLTGTTLGVPTTAANNGIIQYAGNSDKKFEVYSIGLLDGKHLFPTYVPTTTAATSWDGDDINMSSIDNWQQDDIIVLFRYKPSIVNDAGLLSLNGSVNSLLYNSFTTTDGTNTTDEAKTYAKDDDIIIGIALKGTQVSIMASVNGGSFTNTDGTYDGAYDLTGGLLSIAKSAKALRIQSLQFYDSSDLDFTESKQWITDNAHRVTEV